MATVLTPIIKTRAGAVRGSIADGAHVFRGIPFAAAPFGANRLLPPQPVAPWSGVRDALTFGPKAPQPAYPPQIAVMLPPELVPSGEDCLTLNIWTPDIGAVGLPVMVWIAGGMFEYHATGASSWYDGGRFARDGVVCVTINYRVGPEGFLYLGAGNANRGLLDQIAALNWVRENIAAFGGDPGNVTIFGESAGAMSVGTLLAMPAAEGLFRRAIAESGAAHHVSGAATAERIARLFAEKLGVAASREALAAVPVDRALAAQGELMADLFASTTGTDSDWIVKLIDVYPEDYEKRDVENDPYKPGEYAKSLNGYELIIAAEVARARFRKSFEKPQPLPPNQVTEYKIPLRSHDHVFRKGHRILVQVQSTWFPIIDRNPQRFVPNIFQAKAGDFIKATQRVYGTAKAPSHIALPVMPTSSAACCSQ